MTATKTRSEPNTYEPKISPEGVLTENIISERTIGRSRLHDKSRGVCRACNNEWMGRLQDRAKAELEGHFYGRSHTFTHEQQSLLTEWAMMTAMVLDDHLPGHTQLQAPATRAFGQCRLMPISSSVWVGRYVGEADHAKATRGGLVLCLDDEEGSRTLLGVSPHVIWALGDLAFLVLPGFTVDELLALTFEKVGFRQIYPMTKPLIDLSLAPAVQDGFVRHVAAVIHVLLDEAASSMLPGQS